MARLRHLLDLPLLIVGGATLASCAAIGATPTTVPVPPPGTSTVTAVTPTAPTKTATAGVDVSQRPELFVNAFAFVPGRADVAFTTDHMYPAFDGPTVYVQHVNDSGALQPDAEKMTTLPLPALYVAGLWTNQSGTKLALFASLANDLPNVNNDVWLVGAGGSAPSRVGIAALHSYGLEISPDGTQLAILTGNGELVVRDVATGKQRQLADDLWAAYGGPGGDFVFAPDGQSLALVTRQAGVGSQLDLINVASGKRGRLVHTAAPTDIGGITFSRDGHSVYYVAEKSTVGGPTDSSESPYDTDLYRVDARPGAMPEHLANLWDLTKKRGSVMTLTLHPNGRQLLVNQNDVIYALDVTGTKATPLTTETTDPTSDPIVTTAGGRNWMAYTVFHLLGKDSPYHDARGKPIDAVSELRVQPLD